MVEEEEDGNIVESCWGFNGEPKYALEEGISVAKWQIKKDIKDHLKRLKVWIKNRVPLEKREPLII